MIENVDIGIGISLQSMIINGSGMPPLVRDNSSRWLEKISEKHFTAPCTCKE